MWKFLTNLNKETFIEIETRFLSSFNYKYSCTLHLHTREKLVMQVLNIYKWQAKVHLLIS